VNEVVSNDRERSDGQGEETDRERRRRILCSILYNRKPLLVQGGEIYCERHIFKKMKTCLGHKIENTERHILADEYKKSKTPMLTLDFFRMMVTGVFDERTDSVSVDTFLITAQ
jgi:hypothetical protein